MKIKINKTILIIIAIAVILIAGILTYQTTGYRLNGGTIESSAILTDAGAGE